MGKAENSIANKEHLLTIRMPEDKICPIPKEQIPLEEFRELSKSWLFSWPIDPNNNYEDKLFKSWLFSLPISLLIANGSWQLRNQPLILLITVIVSSLSTPLFIIIRNRLAWGYIFKRLVSEQIIYEETGWYDGQIWEKPLTWRKQDLLIAENEVIPLLRKLQNSLLITIYLIVGGSLLGIFLDMFLKGLK